jgi:GNAT superfamily N-acetyltransferase
MKNLKITIFAALSVLAGASSYAMDTKPAEIAPQNTELNCSLGTPYTAPYHYTRNCLRQDLKQNNTSVGYIRYIDSYENGAAYRRVDSLFVQENMRKTGIGSECMRQFIEQSQRQGIHTIELQTLGHLIHFYERLGFKEVSEDGIYSNMEKVLRKNNEND